MERRYVRPRRRLALLLAVALHPLPVAPATIEVDKTCSLADAIDAANNDDDRGGLCPPGGAGPDTLVLGRDVTLTDIDHSDYDGARGLPVIVSDITIEGNGFTIERDSSAPEFGIFVVEANGTLTLNDATVHGGRSTSRGGALLARGTVVHLDRVTLTFNSANSGGAIYVRDSELWVANSSLSGNFADPNGGGLAARSSTIVVSSSSFSGNRAGVIGGGMDMATSELTLSDSDLRNNVATYRGGGLKVRQDGMTAIESTTFAYNEARIGGAIAQASGRLTLANGTLSRNESSVSGAGIWSSGEATITSSTLSHNDAGTGGGGVFNHGELTVINSTLSGNRGGRHFHGGGVSNYGVATIVSSTITGNSAGRGAGVANYAGTTVTLVASIVAGNTGGDCFGYSPISDAGGNFDGDGSCEGAQPIDPGTDFDMRLADNGGPTLTHALLSGSVAVDAAGACGLGSDQRGFLRDALCDSGSFEQDGTPPNCGDDLVNQPDEECDGLDDASCPGDCGEDCRCAAPLGACCAKGPGGEPECTVTDPDTCEEGSGRFLGIGTVCRPDLDCGAPSVTFSAMSAVAAVNGVRVRWTTTSETDTVGFRVLRRTDGRRAKSLQTVGPLVAAVGSPVAGGSYEVLDTAPAAAHAFEYFIEEIDVFRNPTRHGPILVVRGSRYLP